VCQNAETSTEVFRERGKQNVVLRNHDSSAGELLSVWQELDVAPVFVGIVLYHLKL
jgi:hypothetical protein